MKGIKGEIRENEWAISERVTEHERHLTLGNEQGVVEGKVGTMEKIGKQDFRRWSGQRGLVR